MSFKKFRRWMDEPGNSLVFTGSTMFVIVVSAGILVPLFYRFGPYDFVGEPLQSPSWAYLFGTDQLGRDIFSRTFHAVYRDMGVAFLGVSIPFITGTLIGIILGISKSKKTTSLIGSVIDGINAFPLLILAVASIAFLGPGLSSVIIILSLVNWARYAKIARTKAVVVSKANYIEAAYTLGYPKRRIFRKHIGPNVSSETIAYALSDFIIVILLVAGLSFLGLAATPPAAEWGAMISEGRPYLISSPWVSTFPGIALCWSAISLSLVVDGLNRREGKV
ncbi:MAG: ABC transporter permease [Actinobacteria bacterium]|nr:ABC transporter permease [Actinomycetota bacterium]